MDRFRPLSRQQIARIVGNDQEAIRAFEKLFQQAGQLTPDEILVLSHGIEDAQLAAGSALALVAEADAAVHRLAQDAGLAFVPREPDRVFDYIDLDQSSPHVNRISRMAWNSTDQTLEVGMDYGVVQQVGLETYARVQNSTGSTIPNGSVVGFSGVGSGGVISVEPYLADGSMPALYVLGVMTHELPDSGEIGYCTVWGHVRTLDTSGYTVGDILYADPAAAGGLTNVKPTAPSKVVAVAVVLVDDVSGSIFVRPTIEMDRWYGSFSKTTNASPAAINTAYALTFDAAAAANGVSIGTPTSRIVVADSGLYNFAATLQITSGSSSAKDLRVWFRKNGTDIANTTRMVTTDINGGYTPMAMSEFFSLASGDYVEMCYASTDLNVTISTVAATGYAPASPSITLAVTQIQQ